MREKRIDAYYVVGFLAKSIISIVLIIFVGSFFFPLFYKSINYEWETIKHPEYGFSYEYPTKWGNEFFGESGYKGSKQTKALLSDSPFFGPWISVLVIPMDNPIANNLIDWNSKRWQGDALLYEDEIGGKTVWRTQISHENNTISELIYFERKSDFILIRIIGKVNQINNNREEIDRFLISFDPYADQ